MKLSRFSSKLFSVGRTFRSACNARQGEALHPQDVRDKDRASETATCLDHTCSLLIPPGDISQGCRLTIPGCHGWVPTISLNHWSFLYLKQLVFRLKMTHFGGFEVSPFGNRPFVSLTDKFPPRPCRPHLLQPVKHLE